MASIELVLWEAPADFWIFGVGGRSKLTAVYDAILAIKLPRTEARTLGSSLGVYDSSIGTIDDTFVFVEFSVGAGTSFGGISILPILNEVTIKSTLTVNKFAVREARTFLLGISIINFELCAVDLT